MLVTMNTFLPWYGQSIEAGERVDLPTDVALAYIRTGQAEAVETVEAAAIGPASDNAMKNMNPQLKKRRG